MKKWERIFRSHYRNAGCLSVRGNGPGGQRSYLVYRDGGTAGEMWVGSGKRPAAAWKDACEAMRLTEEKAP